MLRLVLTSLAAAAACLAPAAAAASAAVVVAADPAAQQITALDGTIVWVSGEFGHQRLMQRAPDGTISAVQGTREARSYHSIDLGRSRDNGPLLTYLRCDAGSSCKALWNDLDGRRATYRKLTPPRCSFSTAPSQWRTRVAYGLDCRGSARNRARTGLYVKSGRRAPRRLPRPRDAVKFGARSIESVDLRGTRVAAVTADIYEYSFSQTVGGRGMRWFLAAASEGESDGNARGLAIESASTHWTLTLSGHTGDPNEALVLRQTGDCVQRERLISRPDDEDFKATDLAVDGGALYLLRPGVGIVAHAFTPDPELRCR
jgi:hypothetical protein